MDAKVGTLTRGEVSEQSQWDLSGLYSSDEEWSSELEELERELSGYATFQGTLAQSSATLKACIKFDMNFSRKLVLLIIGN